MRHIFLIGAIGDAQREPCRNAKFGTNVLLEEAKCRVQDQGLYLKGQGHNHGSMVKKWDILPFWGAFVTTCDPILVVTSRSNLAQTHLDHWTALDEL